MIDTKRKAAGNGTLRPLVRPCDHCGLETDELRPLKLSSPRDDGGIDQWTVQLCEYCHEQAIDELP